MGLVWTIIIGFLVGLIARAVLPGRQIMGVILTTLLGIGGSLLAGYAGQALGYYKVGDPVGFVASVVGALVILFIWTKLVNR
ncbi:MAG TPA: GlsB/YeaQ/YmgE family stress response membrane protein [Burkholderiales bacterium]|nr:GlsB/YeaQ/YmgE family stress response membrane protein [Burkholderiales bacterium]